MGRYCGDTYDEPSDKGYPWDFLTYEEAARKRDEFTARDGEQARWDIIRASIFYRVMRGPFPEYMRATAPTDHASDQTSPADRGSAPLHAIRDIAGFLTATLLGALIALGLLSLGADRRCHNDPTLSLCEPATTSQETRR